MTPSNVQAGRISEEPTAPNTIDPSINAKRLIEPAHKTKTERRQAHSSKAGSKKETRVSLLQGNKNQQEKIKPT